MSKIGRKLEVGHFEEKASCKALVPENLVADFGANTHVCRQFVSSLYHSLCRLLDDGDPSLAAMQFEQWRALFGAVAGSDEASNHLRDKRSFRKFARSMGIDRIDVNPPFLVFAVHTYYALLTKLIAYHALARFDSSQRTRFNLLCELSNGELEHELAELERGSIFRTLGLRNFLERDSFSWYLESWGNDTTRAVRLLLGRLKNYDAGTLDDSPEQTGDLLKNLYHRTIPREIRHDLGEYYTPDWLAEHTLNQLGYEGQIDRRLLDPSCGSGTFLVLAIRRLRKTCFNEGLNKQETLEAILNNIVGIDLNPLAVLAARANYVLALGDLFADRTQDISPPVHLADSILDPYDEQTLSIGDFDYVAGNPPWVGWESLPDDYRHRTQPIWEQYGLFPHGGMATILGQGKKDLSMLMSYAVTDHFIKSGGKLGFVVTQSVFKTSGASQGFRRFRFGNREDQVMRVNSVDDLTDFQAFEGASNRTAVFFWTKGEKTEYPVPYRLWQKIVRGRSIAQNATLHEVLEMTRRLPYVAEPVNQNDSTSAWFTAREGVLDAVAGLLGPSNYKAHEGVNSGGANGVYWVDVIEERPDGLVVVQNITEGAKRRVDQVKAEIEEAVVFPLLRGREVRKWRAESTASILMVQDPATRRGIDERVMQRDFPNTHAYLKCFEKPLRARAAFRRYFNRKRHGETIETGPFYSMFNVGKYTFAPYRVVWHRMIAPIEAVVIGCKKGKPLLPQETHAFVACASQEEAFYLAGMLNSTIFSFTAQSYSQTGGKSFGSPHILENLYVPTFDGEEDSHREAARIATDIQASFDQLDAGELKAKEHQLDMVAARVWDIPDSTVDVVWRSMEELRKADLR